MTTIESGSPRQVLLDGAMAYVREHGVTGLSLRHLAAAIGTSHRMLVYHFGSKEGLLVAIVEAVEAEERHRTAALGQRRSGSARSIQGDGLAAGLRAAWAEFSSPEHDQAERLFFELYGQALQGIEPMDSLLPGLVHDWLPEGPAAARQEHRLVMAVVRGLLLDLLATGDRVEVDAAFERFVALVSRPRQPVRGSSPR